ncbi:MAG: prepilin-type N-terminal cleavage/methylation domain-containing protein [Elusimicrobia bacterium]|nr:prepilin-type N-terminal cleavage/methylation domain-containing protein [Elusimicrobiota bacterium]
MRPGRDRPWGFTLIELMLVVAIIGLLAAIALPKFAGLIIKSKEAAVKGKLGAFRSAVSIYYADNEGNIPANLDSLTASGKYLDVLPSISIPTYAAHPIGNGVTHPFGDWGLIAPGSLGGTGPGWGWFLSGGEMRVNCTHPDSTGRVWSTW